MDSDSPILDLHGRQAVAPPWNRLDRVPQVFQMLAPGVPRAVALIGSGRLAIGEVGEAAPSAETCRVKTGGHVVTVNSGLFEFFVLLARTLCGIQRDFTPKGIVEPALTHDQLVERIADIFRDWKQGRYSGMESYVNRTFLMNPSQQNVAEMLATQAVMFVLAHELGHVIIDVDGRLLDAPVETLPSEEIYADWFGVKQMLGPAVHTSPRMRYAGILFAVRAFSFLERLGHRFPVTHPEPHKRVAYVKRFVRSQYPDEITLTARSTIALSYDELLENVENVLLGQGATTTQSSERVRVRLWAILEARTRDQITQERFADDIQGSMKGVDEAVCAEVAGQYYEWLLAPQASDPSGGDLPAMSMHLRSVIAIMPDPARTVFGRVFS